jgi:ribose transport system substrate-binding protein
MLAQRYDAPGTRLEGNKYTVVATLTDQYDRVKAKANAEDVLSRFPDLDAIVGLFAYNGPLSLEALKQADQVGKIQIIAFDEAIQTLQAIKEGAIFGTVVQDPYRYGYESIRVLASLVKGDRSVLPPQGFLNIPARQIRQDNIENFWVELKTKLNSK